MASLSGAGQPDDGNPCGQPRRSGTEATVIGGLPPVAIIGLPLIGLAWEASEASSHLACRRRLPLFVASLVLFLAEAAFVLAETALAASFVATFVDSSAWEMSAATSSLAIAVDEHGADEVFLHGFLADFFAFVLAAAFAARGVIPCRAGRARARVLWRLGVGMELLDFLMASFSPPILLAFILALAAARRLVAS
jgi:hypothetical protein